MMTTNLFVIANVKKLRTGGSFRILLPFSKHLGVFASSIQQFSTVFTIGLSLALFWRAFGISGGGSEPPKPPIGTPLIVITVICTQRLDFSSPKLVSTYRITSRFIICRLGNKGYSSSVLCPCILQDDF